MTEDVPTVDQWIAETIAALPGAQTVPYPDWEAQTFQVGGKHFARLGTDPSGRRIVTVKGDPDVNATLVAAHDGVTPGYYANKRLWISLAIDDADLPRDLVVEALESGYEIVRGSLPRRVRDALDQSATA